jgi:hypothetical protein
MKRVSSTTNVMRLSLDGLSDDVGVDMDDDDVDDIVALWITFFGLLVTCGDSLCACLELTLEFFANGMFDLVIFWLGVVLDVGF